jgi:hypothetical protein
MPTHHKSTKSDNNFPRLPSLTDNRNWNIKESFSLRLIQTFCQSTLMNLSKIWPIKKEKKSVIKFCSPKLTSTNSNWENLTTTKIPTGHQIKKTLLLSLMMWGWKKLMLSTKARRYRQKSSNLKMFFGKLLEKASSLKSSKNQKSQ